MSGARSRTRRIVEPEKVHVAPAHDGDTTSFNLVAKPFKDVFDGVIRLVAADAAEAGATIFGHAYQLRVVEALLGMWLSRVTYYVLGTPAAAYEETLIGLVEPKIARALQRHAIVGDGSTPNFPNVYQAGDVPPGYDERQFDPDEIYPGQRFFMLRAAEEVVFDEGATVEARAPSFWDEVWVAAVWGAQAELGVGGAHDAYGPVINVGDLLRYHELRRFAGLCVHGWTVGLGVGASSGATVIIFMNFSSVESLNATEDEGWDWDVAVGAKIPKGSAKVVRELFELIHGLKTVKKFEKTGKKGEAIKTAIETLVKNLKGGLPQHGKEFRIALPVPFTGPGLNLWVGKKATQYETFWAKDVPGVGSPPPDEPAP